MRITTSAAMAVVGAAIAIAGLTAGPATAAPASASASATAGPSAARAAAPVNDQLTGVSCETDKDCLAVGTNSANPTHRAPGALTWNGKAWTPASAKLPAGAVAGWLDGVSCPPAAGTHCVTTGAFSPKKFGWSYWTGLADTVNGAAWTPALVDGTANVELSSVSCLTASDCLAVGSDQSPVGGYSQGVAFRWHGGRWTEIAPPVPPANNGNQLNSVSCAAGPFCVAVGYAGVAQKPISYAWNGTAWKTMTPAQPKGVTQFKLTGVSCTSAKSCTAVGNVAGQPGAVAEVWNGKSWTVTAPMAWPSGTSIPRVLGVSCSAPGHCTAVGWVTDQFFEGSAPVGEAAASVWNGKTWTAAPVPPTGRYQQSYFNSVTCTTATFCVAVGEYGPALGGTPGMPLSGFWDGARWHLKAAK